MEQYLHPTEVEDLKRHNNEPPVSNNDMAIVIIVLLAVRDMTKLEFLKLGTKAHFVGM